MEKEVTKLMTKKGDLEKQIEKVTEKMAKNDYKEKVPVKVQELDAEKVGRKKNVFAGFPQVLDTILHSNYFPFSTAAPEPDWTGEGKRSHRKLQENDVTFPIIM